MKLITYGCDRCNKTVDSPAKPGHARPPGWVSLRIQRQHQPQESWLLCADCATEVIGLLGDHWPEEKVKSNA